MSNLLKFKTILALASFCTLLAGTAAAQSAANNQLQSSNAKHHFSAGEVSAILAEFEIQSALAPYDGNGSATLIAQTSGDAKFVVSLFGCENPADGSQCGGAVIYTATSNAGIAYDDINKFNADSSVTMAVNVAEQNIIVFGRQLFFSGGVGRGNFKYITALFLRDMQDFMDLRAAAGTSVSLNVAPAAAGKTDNVADAGDMPAFAAKSISLDDVDSHVLSAAIANTWHVSFNPPSMPASE
ncbi:hypothetical protein MNBD_ALPHA05-1562 [hydrothermal vent metagenome]|uniref:YbjN domain-containing protein n=1 Tax=hydrothermal vent metagenome TaxID=652676 RepID=A0A3B0S9S3_9ZZZZ